MRVLRTASSSQIRPPCASTIRRKIDTPSPAPGRLRDGSGPPWKNGSKMRSAPFVLPEAPAEPDLVAKYFRGLGDPTRVRILELLREHGELSVA